MPLSLAVLALDSPILKIPFAYKANDKLLTLFLTKTMWLVVLPSALKSDLRIFCQDSNSVAVCFSIFIDFTSIFEFKTMHLHLSCA